MTHDHRAFMDWVRTIFTPEQLSNGIYQRAVLLLFMKKYVIDTTPEIVWMHFVECVMPTFSLLSAKHCLQVVRYYLSHHLPPTAHTEHTKQVQQTHGPTQRKLMVAMLVAIQHAPHLYKWSALSPFNTTENNTLYSKIMNKQSFFLHYPQYMNKHWSYHFVL